MKVRIEYSRNGTGYNWFVDAWIGGGWKNVSSHKTEDEAKKQAEEIKNA